MNSSMGSKFRGRILLRYAILATALGMVGAGCSSEEVSIGMQSGEESPCGVCEFDHATTKCLGDQCAIDQCLPNYRDCDELPANGCETKVDDNPYDCNLCGNRCNFEPHGYGACMDKLCRLERCDPGYKSCSPRGTSTIVQGPDFTIESSDGEDCETDITTVDNCGDCGVECEPGEQCVAIPTDDGSATPLDGGRAVSPEGMSYHCQ